MQNLSDEQLVNLYLKKAGNQTLEILIQRHLKSVYNFVYKYMHTAAAAEDVTQEAFIKIWKNLKKFNPHYKFKTWAFTIAKNTALDALKKKSLVPFAEIEGQNNPLNSLVARGPLPQELMEKIDSVEMLGLAVNKLSENSKKILELYYHQGLNFREIGENLNQPQNTVKTRHRRAINFLKKQFEKI